MRSYESLKKELVKAHSNFSPYKDNRTLTPNILKSESKILKSILKILRPVIKFIDEKIMIEDSISTSYYGYNPSYIFDLNTVSTFGEDLIFKKKKVDFGSPSRKHVTDYYKKNDKIIKGIMISLNLITSDSQYYADDLQIGESDDYGYPASVIEFIRETSSSSVVIYLLRDFRIIKFDRYIRDEFLFNFDHTYSLKNPQELSVNEFLQYDSPKRVLTNILLAYHKAIIENENKFPILKKSLEAILKIKKKYSNNL